MTDSTIFEGKTTPETTTTTATTEQSMLAALVGETQKYKTAEELAKAYANADAFIEQLKEETRKLREQVAQAKTIDDVLERIQKPTAEVPPKEPPEVSGIKPEDVQTLVERTLEQKERERIRSANLLAADKAMKEKFGEKAADIFNSMASTPEVKKTLMELAAVDPSKFVAVFTGQPAVAATAVDTSSVVTGVTSSTSNRASIEGTKEWANKIRKDNPNLYWSTEFQTKLQTLVTKNPTLYFG